MGGSAAGSKSKSKSSNNYNFNQTIPEFQQKALSQMYGNAANLFGQTTGGQQSLIPGQSSAMDNVFKQTQSAWQSALGGGIFGNMGLQSQLGESLQQSLSSPTNTQQIYADVMGGKGNNYADAMKASYIGDANRATDNMLANMDARAAASGMSGGSRHGIATSRGLYDINSNLQRNLAETGYNTFDKDLTNKLNIAGQADSNTLQRQQMMQNMLGTAQDTSNNAIGNAANVQNLGMGAFAPFMAPWDGLNNYAAAIGSPTVLSNGGGSGSGSSKALANSASGGK